MHHHLHLILAAFGMLLLAACSDSGSDIIMPEPEPSSIPVSFSALTHWDTPQTRLAEDANSNAVSFTSGDAIGVFAYLNDHTSPDFMNNQKVVYNGNGWEYEPVKYWPQDGNLTFYGYYPCRENDKALQATPLQDGSLNIAYDCPKADIDLMVSEKVRNQRNSTNEGCIPLAFRHLLARVCFTFTYEGDEKYHPVIHVLRYVVPHVKGMMTCYAGNADDKFDWSVSESGEDAETTIERYVTNVAGTVLQTANQLVPEFTAYLMPYAFPYSSDSENKIGDFTISLNNKLYTITPKSQIALEMGKSYKVNFKITNDSESTGSYFITSYSIWKEDGTFNGTLE